MQVISGLARFGFVVNCLTPDGATENRSFAKQMCTYSVFDLLLNTIYVLCPKLLKIFDMDTKIAFDHPIYRDTKIFVSSDPPHLMKKMVNVLERSPNPKENVFWCIWINLFHLECYMNYGQHRVTLIIRIHYGIINLHVITSKKIVTTGCVFI